MIFCFLVHLCFVKIYSLPIPRSAKYYKVHLTLYIVHKETLFCSVEKLMWIFRCQWVKIIQLPGLDMRLVTLLKCMINIMLYANGISFDRSKATNFIPFFFFWLQFHYCRSSQKNVQCSYTYNFAFSFVNFTAPLKPPMGPKVPVTASSDRIQSCPFSTSETPSH